MSSRTDGACLKYMWLYMVGCGVGWRHAAHAHEGAAGVWGQLVVPYSTWCRLPRLVGAKHLDQRQGCLLCAGNHRVQQHAAQLPACQLLADGAMQQHTVAKQEGVLLLSVRRKGMGAMHVLLLHHRRSCRCWSRLDTPELSCVPWTLLGPSWRNSSGAPAPTQRGVSTGTPPNPAVSWCGLVCSLGQGCCQHADTIWAGGAGSGSCVSFQCDDVLLQHPLRGCTCTGRFRQQEHQGQGSFHSQSGLGRC
jgi:hypothetical protein